MHLLCKASLWLSRKLSHASLFGGLNAQVCVVSEDRIDFLLNESICYGTGRGFLPCDIITAQTTKQNGTAHIRSNCNDVLDGILSAQQNVLISLASEIHLDTGIQ